MGKAFNFRPSVFLALFTAAGIFCGFMYIRYGALAAALPSAAMLLLLSLSFIRFPLKGARMSAAIKTLQAKRLHTAAFCAAAVLGFMLFFVSMTAFGSKQQYYGSTADVSGSVIDTYKSKDEKFYFLLEDAAFRIEDKDYSPKGKVFVYVNAPHGQGVPQSGDRVSFTAKVGKNDVYQGGYINTYAVRNDIHYTFFLNEDGYSVQPGTAPLFTRIRQAVKSELYKYLRPENAAISYALIIGDSLHMDRELKAAFTDGGIAHIFSVSGLHVSVLSAAIIFVLKKFKATRLTQLITVSAILLAYSALSGFAPAVVRTFFMTEIFLLSAYLGHKYDPLSSVSFAVFIMLILTPLTLFDAGFLLSAGAVYAIFILKRTFDRALRFLPKAVRGAASLSLCAQAGITPILCYYFNSVQLLSILLNVIAIPFVSICFIALLILLPVCALLPFAGFLYFLPQGLLELVKVTVVLAGQTGLTALAVKPLGAASAVSYYAVLITVSGFMLWGKRAKRVLVIALSAVFALSTAAAYLPKAPQGESFSAINLDGMHLSAVTQNGSFTLVDYGLSTADFDDFEHYMFINGLNKVDCYISFSPGAASVRMIKLLKKSYGLQFVIMPFTFDNTITDALQDVASIKYLLSNERFIHNNLTVSAYYYNDSYYAGYVSTENVGAVYVTDIAGAKKQNNVGNLHYMNADILFLKNYDGELAEKLNPRVLVYTEGDYSQKAGSYSVKVLGNLIFYANNDTIIRKYKY